MEKRYPLPTVAALVRGPSGRVLIVKTTKWHGLWGVPGGKIDWGETSEQALLREFQEEVGLHLYNVRFALYMDCVNDPQFYKEAHFTFANYFADTTQETVTPNQEIEQWVWESPLKALEYPLNSYTRILIERFLEQA